MTMHGKNYKTAKNQTNSNASLPLKQALQKTKDLAYAKFDESIDLNINLGIDPAKGDQVVRGSVLLPHSIGKKVKVVVFAKGDYADQARDAGADYVGVEDLVDKISEGWLDFDYAVATPDLMGAVSKLAKILGPKGLLPNKKLGTVTFDVAQVVADLKKGRLFFKNDKNGIVHFKVGKKSFDINQLYENTKVFLKALQASKPSTAKGKFIKNITASSTMDVGLSVDPDDAISA